MEYDRPSDVEILEYENKIKNENNMNVMLIHDTKINVSELIDQDSALLIKLTVITALFINSLFN